MLYFPEHLGCWSSDGFTNTGGEGIYGLGNGVIRGDMNSILAKFIIIDEENLNTFLVWWKEDAADGNNKFLTELPFFGGVSVEVATVGDLVSKRHDGYWEIGFNLVTIVSSDLESLKKPNMITDLEATEPCGSTTTLTWTDQDPVPLVSYDLYHSSGILIEKDIVSPYDDTNAGVRTYYILSVSPKGSTKSNTATGSAKVFVTDFFGDGSGIGLWRFDGDKEEEEGRYTTTAIGSPTWAGTPPAFPCQTAYYSNQNGAYKTNLVDLPQNVSVSFWTYQDNVPADAYSPFVFNFSKDNQKTFGLIFDEYINEYDVMGLWANNTLYRTGAFSMYGHWQHWAITSTGKAYKNGVHVPELDFPSIDMTTINKEFVIGADRDGDNTFNDFSFGYIAMFRVFGKALTQTDVDALYAEEG